MVLEIFSLSVFGDIKNIQDLHLILVMCGSVCVMKVVLDQLNQKQIKSKWIFKIQMQL